jgi:hypothetical protein
MIIDSLDYKIEHLNVPHLHPFPNDLKIVNLTPSIPWTKYTYQLNYSSTHSSSNSLSIKKFLIEAFFKIQAGLFYLTLPISFSTFYVLNHFHLINDIYVDGFSGQYYKTCDFISNKMERINSVFSGKSEPTVTFMIPYIKFVSAPQNYSWWRELIKPQPSPFVETINREIYKTWNGEALINFKWNLYGAFAVEMIETLKKFFFELMLILDLF